MNELNDQSSYEERFSYFDAANDSRTGYINFEEFLKMMNTLKQNRGSEDKSLPLADRFKSDTSTSEMTGIVRQMDSFQQMCYGVF